MCNEDRINTDFVHSNKEYEWLQCVLIFGFLLVAYIKYIFGDFEFIGAFMMIT